MKNLTKTSFQNIEQDIGDIKSKQDLLLNSLKKFYENSYNRELIIPIVKQQTTISLRLLDWLVTNYAKQNNIHYTINEGPEHTRNFNIWLDYKNQLKAFSKKCFDPFCRRNRVFFDTKNNVITSVDKNEDIKDSEDGFITTVGQLNFFRWAITNKVIEYVFKNLSEIEVDMFSSADSRKLEGKKGTRRRREISKNNRGVHKHEIKIIIQFP